MDEFVTEGGGGLIGKCVATRVDTCRDMGKLPPDPHILALPASAHEKQQRLVAFGDDQADFNEEVAVQLDVMVRLLDEVVQKLEDRGSDPFWEDEGDVNMPEVVDDPPPPAPVASVLECKGRCRAGPLEGECIKAGRGPPLAALTPLGHKDKCKERARKQKEPFPGKL